MPASGDATRNQARLPPTGGLLVLCERTRYLAAAQLANMIFS